MIVDTENSNHIIADKCKVFRRKSDKTIWGEEVMLTEVITNGCQILDTPIKLTVSDFEEIDKPVHSSNDDEEEVIGKISTIKDDENEFDF